jgi:Peptidase family M23
MFKVRYLGFLIGLAITAFIGWSTYLYFFDTVSARLTLGGVESELVYAGDIKCTIQSDKKGEISLFLDEIPLASKYAVSASEEYPFSIPTKTVGNGQHTLKIEMTDSRFAKNRSVLMCDFFVDNQPLQAMLIKSEEVFKVFQGRTLRVQIQTNKELQSAVVNLFSRDYECFPESENSTVYETYIPIDCQEVPNEYLLTATLTDKVGNVLKLDSKVQVVMFPFKKHTLQVSEEKMKEEDAFGPDNQRCEEVLQELTDHSVRKKLWKGAFCAPMDIAKVTCEFGTIRTTQRKGRYAHRALDVINTPRSVVWAPQNGIIVLKERFTYTGNMVVIDHGWGILSIFCHLDDFAKINVGDAIVQGNPIGTEGKTGYATGYHLHWEMRVGNVPVDPMQWTRSAF